MALRSYPIILTRSFAPSSLNAVVVGAPPRINMSRPMLSLSQSTEIKILAIPEGPAGRSGCCWGTKRIWDDSEIESLYVRENSVEIFSPIHNKRCCSSAFHSSADVLYFDSPWTVRPAGSVSALRGFFFAATTERRSCLSTARGFVCVARGRGRLGYWTELLLCS